jgi:hypothetical protein
LFNREPHYQQFGPTRLIINLDYNLFIILSQKIVDNKEGLMDCNAN